MYQPNDIYAHKEPWILQRNQPFWQFFLTNTIQYNSLLVYTLTSLLPFTSESRQDSDDVNEKSMRNVNIQTCITCFVQSNISH